MAGVLKSICRFMTRRIGAITQERRLPGRFEFQRGILQQRADGQFEVSKTGKQGSGILTSMSQANCFILLDEDSATVQAGDTVVVQPFDLYL